jgi:predicted TIM-barrel fold metal-dependent hydrolase
VHAIRITNCHIHTFTDAHVPRWYPAPLLVPFRKVPGLARGVSRLLALLGQENAAATVGRLARFRDAGDKAAQRRVLEQLLPMYPEDTRFVVLPMDMAHIGYGPVKRGLRAQHEELAALAAAWPGRVIPFATCFPGAAESVAEAERAIRALGFRGLKLYPRLGFPPDHPALVERLYPLLAERGLPVMSHCSRGGVQGRWVTAHKADLWTAPQAFLPVLDRFAGLRVCLAHFGGQRDWDLYVNQGVKPERRSGNWLAAILDLIRSGDHPNLWTDISYTIFQFEDYIPFLKVFLKDERLAARILFGSDYYMTTQERLSERAVSFRLRDAVGEELFRRIAETNPEIWLGERAAA